MTHKNILLCEDDEDMAELLKHILTKEGHRVFYTNNCEDIWTMLASSTPDLILMDLKIPCMGGAEATRLLKSSEQTNHLRVVLLSAYNGLSDIAAEAGADGYLAKPFDIHGFRKILD